MTELSVRSVGKSFGQVRALNEVSFDVDSGSTTALLGPSGCGKTTLLRIVGGFEQPDAGTVWISDQLVSGAGVSTRPEHRSIGYVAQEGALFPHLTVAGNIQFALHRAERRAKTRLAELLELVSLDADQLTRYPHQLSGGQQQRVALARALARRPSLMLLDEPFAALDASLRADTRDLMAAALAAEKVTTVLVTHDQEEALSFADQVVVLRDGRVRQAGRPRDLYNNPADQWTAQFLGDAVLVPATVTSGRASSALGTVPVSGETRDGPTTLMMRPEQLRLTPIGDSSHPDSSHGDSSHGDSIYGDIIGVSYRGHDTVATVRLAVHPALTISCRSAGDPAGLQPGVQVQVTVTGEAQAFDAD